MARQKGVLSLEGKAGKLTFIHGRDGFGARSADGMNGKRIATDQAFERTRENGAEFGRAGKAGKLLRDSLRELLHGVADGRVTGRLTKEMLKVVKSDASNDRGLRTASLGNVKLLEGFEFNIKSPLKSVLVSDVGASINKTAGSGKINLPVFNPMRDFVIPDGATHYQFRVGLASLDFDGGVSKRVFNSTAMRELVNDELVAEEITVVFAQSPGNRPLFLVFGVAFTQMVNGKAYGLKDVNALRLMAAE